MTKRIHEFATPHRTVTADEAMSQQAAPEERSETDDAKAFLRDLLADGPVPSKQIQADAAGAGHAWRTIQRAQKALGIESVKKGGHFGTVKQQRVWRLAGTEERHTNCMVAFRFFRRCWWSSG